MTSLNISLPKSMKDYVSKQAKESGFDTPSDFVQALLRDDQDRRSEKKLEVLLLEGINAGSPIEITSQYWEKKRRRLMERHKNKKNGK